MTAMWAFFGEHWFLGFIALAGTLSILHGVLFRLPNRILRSRNIVARGWPPNHLDADGDFESTGDSP